MDEPALGVILTAGRGHRLEPLTPATPKALIPLLNRPLLAYALDLCAGLGLSEAVVVVSGDHGDVAAEAQRLAPPGLSVSTAVQSQPRGIGDAVTAVGPALDGRAVVVLAVDTLLRAEIRPALDAFGRAGAAAGLLLHPTDRPREMGIAALDGDRVVDLVEKPQAPRSDLAVVGLWMLGQASIERLRSDPAVRSDGEIDLTGTIAAMVAEGADVRGWRLDGEWLDAGSIGSLLTTQSRLLAGLAPAWSEAREGEPAGAVAAGETRRVAGSTLIGPVLIGDGAVIEGSTLGPDVVVGEGAVLRSVRLRGSMVVAGARLADASHEGVVVTASGEIATP